MPHRPQPRARDGARGRAGHVQLVRRDGRDVSTLYGREGGGARGAGRGLIEPPLLLLHLVHLSLGAGAGVLLLLGAG